MLGERLRALRLARGWSPTALAQKGGVGENAIRKLESGITKEPSFTVGVRLARALGVSPWELAFGESESTRLTPAAETAAPDTVAVPRDAWEKIERTLIEVNHRLIAIEDARELGSATSPRRRAGARG